MSNLPIVLHDKILVRRDATDTHAGGIELAEGARVLKNTGLVLGTGDGVSTPDPHHPGFRIHHYLQVRAGDRITFSPFVTGSVRHEGEELLVMKEEDVICINSRAESPLQPPEGSALDRPAQH